MKLLFPIVAIILTFSVSAQSKNERAVREILQQQTAAWNRGDIDGFMQTYWRNDSLMFVGRDAATFGWQQTLDNYKKSYPDKTAMGLLDFKLVRMTQLSGKYFFVVGQWHLARAAGDLHGAFSLLVKKINGAWKIVTDHSS